MPRRVPDPDLELCLAALPPSHRAFVGDILADLGLPPDGWKAVPPLRRLVTVLAVVRVAGGLGLPHGDAVRAAVEALGLPDEAHLTEHPGERFLRLLRRWSADAWAADIFDRMDSDAAA
jgi:hypothetical protein